MPFTGSITDAQLVSALRASGANEEEAARFSRAIRARIDQLQRVAKGPDLSLPKGGDRIEANRPEHR